MEKIYTHVIDETLKSTKEIISRKYPKLDPETLDTIIGKMRKKWISSLLDISQDKRLRGELNKLLSSDNEFIGSSEMSTSLDVNSVASGFGFISSPIDTGIEYPSKSISEIMSMSSPNSSHHHNLSFLTLPASSNPSGTLLSDPSLTSLFSAPTGSSIRSIRPRSPSSQSSGILIESSSFEKLKKKSKGKKKSILQLDGLGDFGGFDTSSSDDDDGEENGDSNLFGAIDLGLGDVGVNAIPMPTLQSTIPELALGLTGSGTATTGDADTPSESHILSKTIKPTDTTARLAIETAESESEEDALGSDLDDEEEEIEIQNVMVCIVSKVKHNKLEWKCDFKSGIMIVEGKEYSFKTGKARFVFR